MLPKLSLLTALLVPLTALGAASAPGYRPPEPDRDGAAVFRTGGLDRPLRYTPMGTDFVITNGAEFFNRPLYGGSSPFRVDGGDRPEFSLYLPGRGGNLRFGLKTGTGVKWLNEAAQVVTRYRPGSLIHEIHDPLPGEGWLTLTTLALPQTEGMIVRAEWHGPEPAPELCWAFGGVNGMKGKRDGDIGCEVLPVSQFFQLHAAQCTSNVVTIGPAGFSVQGRPGTIAGAVSDPAQLTVGDAANWDQPAELLAATNLAPATPLLVGRARLRAGQPFYLALQRVSPEGQPAAKISPAGLPVLFAQAEEQRQALAGRVAVATPDPFINAAAAALNVAADAVWDDRQQAYLHGGVAWRIRLLGWRASYAGDELGWHERTAGHFAGFAAQQTVTPIPAAIPAAEESAKLARNETALHSNGDLSKSHYDMNLVAVDAFFRHLLWTGDLAYAEKMWPVIERHLAWERRLFRREFGADKRPLYEAYCCIWASDDLAYNGGGATHASAYNYYHNRLAARVAKLLGRDATPYEQEAGLIAQGMKENLWLADCGWFAEWKDWLGRQQVHPNAAVWTFYHTVDSEVPSPLEAWQMSRFVDTQIPHFPLRGPGVPAGSQTISTTSWMPYTWSLNNVVMAETMHTALAYWQAGRPEGAFPLFKGALLDSMYLGLCPGNVGMCTFFDANRRESQRDFGDGSGATARALIEGLFGVQPDLLAGEIKLRPGFPAEWNHASIRHPDFNFSFQRDGRRETFALETRTPLKLRLQIPALRDRVEAVTVNGRPAAWRVLADAVGTPHIEIETAPAPQQTIVVEWRGQTNAPPPAETAVAQNAAWRQALTADITELADPQGALSEATFAGCELRGRATGRPGHRTVFARVTQGQLRWWQPVALEISAPPTAAATDWTRPVTGKLETIDLSPVFNDQVTQIFRNEYRAPRSPFCSLATPTQGIGSWCHPLDNFAVDDTGLRTAAARQDGKIVLPNGVPLATPAVAGGRNIVFVSQWTNYPAEVSVPLGGKSAGAYLLLAGSTGAMQSRCDNGEVIATYTDGSTTRLALHNPTTWWPIDQDYYVDDFAFARPEALPIRIDLRTGKIRVLQMDSFKGTGGAIPGGAATVLALPLDATKELQSLTIRALANEVVIGLMSLTLAR